MRAEEERAVSAATTTTNRVHVRCTHRVEYDACVAVVK